VTAAAELLLDTPASRPCTHRTEHRHGTLVRYAQDRCRCLPCREAAAAYARARREALKHGSWTAYIDAGPARDHVRELMRAGLSWKTVAERAGLNRCTVERILYGGPPDWAPQKRIREETARKLLAVKAGRRRMPQAPDLLTTEADT
jgi:AraC-like DNA-binding protein